MEEAIVFIGAVVVGISIIAVFSIVWGLVLAWAWNVTIPHILHLPTINWLQGFALSLLFATLRGIDLSKKKE